MTNEVFSTLKFEKSLMDLDVYGAKHQLRFPASIEIESYTKKSIAFQEEQLGESEIEICFEFLENMGLPREDSQKLELDHLTEVIKVLLTKKKE